MFCRIWSSVGLVFWFVASPLFAQGWPTAATPYSAQPIPRAAGSLPPAGGAPPIMQGVVPATPYLPPPQGGHFADAGNTLETWYDVQPNQGLYFQYDYLYWSLSAPDTTVIGDEGSEGLVTTTDGVTFYHENSLDTSWLESKYSPGNRFEFGHQNDHAGWLVSVLQHRQVQSLGMNGVDFVPQDPYSMLAGYGDGDGDGIDDDLNNNNVYGRYGQDLGISDGNNPPAYGLPFDGAIDTPAPIDTGDQVLWLVTYESMNVAHVTELVGFEVMSTQKSSTLHAGGVLEWICGVRYLQYRESFGINGSGGFLDVTNVDVDADNDIVGPQIGLRWRRQSGYVTLSAEGRFAPAINFQRADMVGHLATTQEPGGQNKPVSLNALGFNAAHDSTAFSPIGEFRLETICHINPWLGLRLGYSGLVAGGISRASEKVTYALPAFQLSGNASREVIYTGGLTVGVELNR